MTVEEIREEIILDICGINEELSINQSDLETLEKEIEKINKHGDWFKVKPALQDSYKKRERRITYLNNMLAKAEEQLRTLPI